MRLGAGTRAKALFIAAAIILTKLDGTVITSEMMRRIQAFDPAAVLRAEEEEAASACGRAAIAAVLWAARELGGTWVSALAYANSGEVTGDKSSVVGYGSAAIWRTAPA